MATGTSSLSVSQIQLSLVVVVDCGGQTRVREYSRFCHTWAISLTSIADPVRNAHAMLLRPLVTDT